MFSHPPKPSVQNAQISNRTPAINGMIVTNNAATAIETIAIANGSASKNAMTKHRIPANAKQFCPNFLMFHIVLDDYKQSVIRPFLDAAVVYYLKWYPYRFEERCSHHYCVFKPGLHIFYNIDSTFC